MLHRNAPVNAMIAQARAWAAWSCEGSEAKVRT